MKPELPEWTWPNRAAWIAVYQQLQKRGQEYYFDNFGGWHRCYEDAQAGKSPGPEHWALFVAERMKG